MGLRRNFKGAWGHARNKKLEKLEFRVMEWGNNRLCRPEKQCIVPEVRLLWGKLWREKS